MSEQRLEQTKKRWALMEPQKAVLKEDVDWLIAEVERLREESGLQAGLQGQGGGETMSEIRNAATSRAEGAHREYQAAVLRLVTRIRKLSSEIERRPVPDFHAAPELVYHASRIVQMVTSEVGNMGLATLVNYAAEAERAIRQASEDQRPDWRV